MGDITENIGQNPIVFLDVTIKEERVGRIVIELFKDICPRTAENFRALCTGERGIGSLGKKLHFKDSIFHKAVPECLIQGGDITNFDGSGGESIYGPIFEDENFIMEHRFGGELSMANRGVPHSNNSQFCITTAPCFHLNGAHVVFGKVLKGLDVAKEVSYVPVGPKENPLIICKIADCGELKNGDDWGVNENDGTEDMIPLYPSDWDKSPEEIKEDSLIEVTTAVKNSGNLFYKNGKLVDAIIKYKKALRYITWYKSHLRKTGNLDRATVFKELELHCNLNCALVKVKKGYYKEALTYCAAALSIDSHNVKAICRRAEANFALNNYELALADYKLAASLAPNITSILNDIRRVKKAQFDYLQFEKIIYAKMLNSA